MLNIYDRKKNDRFNVTILIGMALIGVLILSACQGTGGSTTKTEAPPAATQASTLKTETPASSQPTAAGSSQATVNISDNKFDPKELTITAGTTVTFTNSGNRTHTVTADDGSFDSGRMLAGATFEFTFTAAGEYPYHCEIHGGPGGSGMSGTIIVTAGN